ncbi:Group II intron-encoded protein LtrA [compost metagenome]
MGWVFEADLKNFFSSLDHEWMMKFEEHRIGDPRILQLIQCWLKVGVLEDGKVYVSEQGTSQGGCALKQCVSALCAGLMV